MNNAENRDASLSNVSPTRCYPNPIAVGFHQPFLPDHQAADHLEIDCSMTRRTRKGDLHVSPIGKGQRRLRRFHKRIRPLVGQYTGSGRPAKNRLTQTATCPVAVGGRKMASNATRQNKKTDIGVEGIEPLVAVDQAAYLLGISPKTLRDWVQYRKIEFVKVGTRVLFRPETIRNLVASNTRHPEAG